MTTNVDYLDPSLSLSQRKRSVEKFKSQNLMSFQDSEKEISGQIDWYKSFYEKYSSDNEFKSFLYSKIKTEFFDSWKIQWTPEKLFYSKYWKKIKWPQDWALPNLMRLFSYLYIYDRDSLSKSSNPWFAWFVWELNYKSSDLKKLLTLKDEVPDKAPNIINPLSTDTNLEKYHFLVQLYNFERFVEDYQNEQSKSNKQADLVNNIKPDLKQIATSVQPKLKPEAQPQISEVEWNWWVVEKQQEAEWTPEIFIDFDAIAKEDWNSQNSTNFMSDLADSVSEVADGIWSGFKKIWSLFSSGEADIANSYDELKKAPKIWEFDQDNQNPSNLNQWQEPKNFLVQSIPVAPEKQPLPKIWIDVTYLKWIWVKVESRYVKFTNKNWIESRRKVTYCVISTRETLKKLLHLTDKDVLSIIPHGDASKKIKSFKLEIAKAKKEKKDSAYLQLDYFKALDYMRRQWKEWKANLFPIYVETPNWHAALAIYWSDDNIHFIDTLAKDKVTQKSWNVNPIPEDVYVLGKYKFYVPVKWLLVSNEHVLQLAQNNQDKKRKKSS